MTRLLPLLLLILAAPARALDLSSSTTLGISNEALIDDNRITGTSPQSSFLTPGLRYVDNAGFLYKTKTSSANWEGALDGRFTDDPRIDEHHQDLKRFYLKRDTKQNSAIAGDFFGSFSNYTMGKAIKGGMFTQKWSDGSQLVLLSGFDKPNWSDVWFDNPAETVDRQVYGARVQRPLLGDGQLGLSFVWSKDEQSRFNTTNPTLDNRVVGADWTLPVWHKLALWGESAYAHTNVMTPDVYADSVTVATPGQQTRQDGWANIVHGRWSHGRFKSTDDFERVDAGFATAEGAATPDLERYKTSNTVTISGPWKWIMLNYTYFHNNLANYQGVPVSATRMPETGLRYEAPDWRPDLAIETKLRDREVTSSSDGSRERTRSVVTTVNDRFGPLTGEVDYEYQFEDNSNGSESGNHNILGIGSNGLFKLPHGWKFTEGLRWDLERDRDYIQSATDQTGTIKANVSIKSPYGADAGGSYSRSLVLNALSPGNDRRSWTASIGYNILKKEDHRIELRFRENNNLFQTPGMDYKEIVWELALTDRL